MSDITSSEDGFTRTAGRQLALFFLMAIGGVAALMWVLSIAASLTSSGTTTSQAVDAETGTVTIAFTTEPPQLDSTLATDMQSGMVLGHVMEGLLTYDANNEIAPGVAERWEIGENDATFWLREDARWSDGETVTAHDFVFAWRTALDPKRASEYAFILYPIKNAEAVNTGKLPLDALGAQAVDDRTLTVQFERPLAYFDKLVAFTTYLPVRQDFFENTDGKYGADADKLLYNGPFMMTSWVHGASLRMDKNPHYWNRDKVKLNTINVGYITPDPNARLNLFKDNNIALSGLTAENLPSALENRWQIHRFVDGSVFFIEFNHREDRVTRNLNLRKAMLLAQDSAELVYKVTKIPGYLPGASLFPTWLMGVDKPLREEYPANLPRMDLELARRHLDLAKRELGVDQIPPLTFLTGDNPISNIQSEYFQAVFKKNLGLDVKIDKQIFKQRLAKMTSGDFDLVLAGWGPDYNDPLTFGDLFASWNLNNRGRYANPELDRQVRIAQSSLDPKTRMDAFGQIQQILIDDAVIIPNYERGSVYVTHPHVKGVLRRVIGADVDYTRAWIDTGA